MKFQELGNNCTFREPNADWLKKILKRSESLQRCSGPRPRGIIVRI